MQSPKIIIYGGRGWIGNQIVEFLQNNSINVIVSQLRVDNYDTILNELNNIKPTHVICCIGRTSGYIDENYVSTIDYLEYPGKLTENLHDNLYGPMLLAQATNQLGIHMTYLGTGCIFQYKQDDPLYRFTENDYPNFFGSSYSVVKGYTDSIIRNYNNVLNVRIRMPISSKENRREFLTKITNYKYICSIANSMTVLDELIPTMLDMSLKYETGTINLVNPGVITHDEILQMYKEIINPSHLWTNITYEEQMTILRSHRSNNHLDTSKLEAKYIDIKNIKDAIKQILINKIKMN